jgi:hypothetical protein
MFKITYAFEKEKDPKFFERVGGKQTPKYL